MIYQLLSTVFYNLPLPEGGESMRKPCTGRGRTLLLQSEAGDEKEKKSSEKEKSAKREKGEKKEE